MKNQAWFGACNFFREFNLCFPCLPHFSYFPTFLLHGSRAFCLHVFPRLQYVFPALDDYFPFSPPVTQFPAFIAGYTISRAWWRLHDFPPLILVTRFPAFDAGNMISRAIDASYRYKIFRAWCRLHDFPRLMALINVFPRFLRTKNLVTESKFILVGVEIGSNKLYYVTYPLLCIQVHVAQEPRHGVSQLFQKVCQ